MPLSDVAIRKAKTTDKAQRLFDRFGLYVEVTPAGSKLWRAEVSLRWQGEALGARQLSGRHLG